MKIPLQFIDGRLTVNAVFSCRGYRTSYSQVLFFIDTGSSKTFICETDALKLKLPLNSLRFKEHTKIAGSTFEILEAPKESILYFKKDDGKSCQIKLSFFCVARTTKKTEDAKLEAAHLPSLIGTDFLLNNKLILYFAPHKNIYYLETEE
ncbi:MAG: hypothetical protein AB1571_03450 [Nanoarchaeota archaeon]